MSLACTTDGHGHPPLDILKRLIAQLVAYSLRDGTDTPPVWRNRCRMAGRGGRRTGHRHWFLWIYGQTLLAALRVLGREAVLRSASVKSVGSPKGQGAQDLTSAWNKAKLSTFTTTVPSLTVLCCGIETGEQFLLKRTGVEGWFICITHRAVRQKVQPEPTNKHMGALCR